MNSLRRWLRLHEATAAIAEITDDFQITEGDVLELALQGRLKLSVVFPSGAWASPCVEVDEADIKYNEVPTLDGLGTIKLPVGGQLAYAPTGAVLQIQAKVIELDADWPYSLPMIGGEASDVEQAFWDYSNIEREETTSLSGTFVAEGFGHARRYFQLKGELPDSTWKARNFYPVGSLPKNAVLVVKHSDIADFAASLSSKSTAPRDTGREASPQFLKWPWGSHHTELLGHLEAAALKFWVNYDRADNTTAPTNEDVTNWLQERGVSKRIADAMATILRVNGLPTGPRT